VSYDEGQSWEVISPDLTRADPETIESSGGPITQDNTGVEYYATVFAVTESPREEGVIWAGSDDGLLHVTRDGGETWKEVTPPMAPRHNMMNCIDVNPFVEGGAYVAATSYKFGDYTPYLYKTTDYGKTWELITAGIPENYYTRAIRADKTRPGLLYAGTEWGMFVSFDDGENWQPFQLNLPTVAIRDLHVRDNNLIAATHGRSFWMIDDLTPLHQLNDEVTDSDFHLYQPKKSYRMAQGGRGSADLRLEGENHPDGVIFHYFIKDIEADDEVKLEVMELDGTPIRSYSNHARKRSDKLEVAAGGNRFIWNMRYPGFTEFDGMVLYSSPNRGPKAVPGIYKARLTVNGESVEQEFEIIPDPRLETTQQGYQEQFDFLMKVRDKVSEAHQAIIDIRSLREDINYMDEKLADDPAYEEVLEKARELDKEMEVIENKIHETRNQSYQDPLNYGIKVNNRLAFLMADQQRGDYPPTDQAREVRQELTQELDSYLNELDQLFDNRLDAINRGLQNKGFRLLNVRQNEAM